MTGFDATFDPYDIWATPIGVTVKRKYYQGTLPGYLGAVVLGLFDWLTPGLSRSFCGSRPLVYPVTVAHEILRLNVTALEGEFDSDTFLKIIRNLAVNPNEISSLSWGLGFPWMSKNGLYSSKLPFVTHTPYVMEALLVIAERAKNSLEPMQMFYQTWGFLESLQVMYKDADNLALSYAPVDEPRIVVNANSYAALSYGLHAVHGMKATKSIARQKVNHLVRWVLNQQHSNGGFPYYADEEPGNFIDCFHSCFVVKNLLKVSQLIPELSSVIKPSTVKGWEYIQQKFYDKETGLCRRFVVRAQRDPFCWDIYDQAEYLGLLVDFGLLNKACQFSSRVEKEFSRGENWFCRKDIFGRKWGKNFLRWGITPFLYHRTRLEKAMGGN